MDLSEHLDWIIIAIIIAISIFSSISKNRKKKAAKMNAPSLPEKTTTDDDPWASIRELIEIPEQETALPEPIPVAEVVQDGNARDMDGRGRAAMAEDGLQAERQKYLEATQGRVPERPRIESRLRNRVSDFEVAGSATIRDEVIEEFNARAAILYSEILKPKF